jgi:benzoyl-CoA reductase subunit D
VDFRRGHFYGMTTHSRGAVFLVPSARAVLDVGALHARAMKIDEKSRVLGYRMTSQCASGSGQFLENVARYLGVALEEVGALSCQASTPEQVSSICAVLAETDVINMVSRGISTANILKGIHQSMSGRYLKLLRAIGAEKDVLVTGGLAADAGLAEAMREQAAEEDMVSTSRTGAPERRGELSHDGRRIQSTRNSRNRFHHRAHHARGRSRGGDHHRRERHRSPATHLLPADA